MTALPPKQISIIGGAGPQGSGLALRLARGGMDVVLGSRDARRSEQIAFQLAESLDRPGSVRGLDNRGAALASEVIVLCVPYGAQKSTATELMDVLPGKILIDVTVPLMPPRVSTVQLLPGGSAAVELQQVLGPEVRVVSAFQNVSATHLHDLSHEVDCDVLVCGDDNDACETAVAVAQSAGLRAWRAGPLANSAAAEALTAVLIAINRRYKIKGAGIRITGTPNSAA